MHRGEVEPFARLHVLSRHFVLVGHCEKLKIHYHRVSVSRLEFPDYNKIETLIPHLREPCASSFTAIKSNFVRRASCLCAFNELRV